MRVHRTEDAHNVVLVGGTGTGKSHLGTAIGVAGITRHAKRVRFYSTVDLVNALEQEKAQGKAGRIASSLLRMDLVTMKSLTARIRSSYEYMNYLQGLLWLPRELDVQTVQLFAV
jgi:DNA replication protein DnaC